MLNTKLILVEGLPGAGKSTTTGYLHSLLQRRSIDCCQFLEDDHPHPIECADFETKGLPAKVVPLWESFAKQAKCEPVITIIESRLWQNTAMFTSPVLLNLDQDHTESALRRLYTFRGKEWVDWAMEWTTQYHWFRTRGLSDFAGWVRFFEEWR